MGEGRKQPPAASCAGAGLCRRRYVVSLFLLAALTRRRRPAEAGTGKHTREEAYRLRTKLAPAQAGADYTADRSRRRNNVKPYEDDTVFVWLPSTCFPSTFIPGTHLQTASVAPATVVSPPLTATSTWRVRSPLWRPCMQARQPTPRVLRSLRGTPPPSLPFAHQLFQVVHGPQTTPHPATWPGGSPSVSGSAAATT